MRKRTGCQSCRERHIKCVRSSETAQCEKCLKNNRECFNTYTHRFKPVRSVVLKSKKGQRLKQRLIHDAMQVWVDLPSTVDFVYTEKNTAPVATAPDNAAATSEDGEQNDVNTGPGLLQPTESHHNPRIEHRGLDEYNSTDKWHTSPEENALLPATGNGGGDHDQHGFTKSSPGAAYWRSAHSTTHEQSTSSLLSSFHTQPGQPLSHSSPDDLVASPTQSSFLSNFPRATSSVSNSPAFSLSLSWPFHSAREARLFYHYIKYISPWIDVLESACYFGKEVPRRAAHDPIISSAIFALSSLHISLLNGEEDHESPRYVDEALQHLQRILEDPLGHSDENLLAGVILLRSHEELSDNDERCHLLGSTRLLNSIASHAADGGFKESASWISLRQHIYISFTSQSPLSLNLSNYQHSGVFRDQTDESWANRIVFIFACVLNYVFGFREPDDGRTPCLDSDRWQELKNEVDLWFTNKPWYFTPLWTTQSGADRSGTGTWPELLTSHAAHAVGLQYYSLCKIVLAIYDPRLAKLSFDSHRLQRASESSVLENIRLAIGLAVSNPDVTNAMFQGSHILTVCGSYLRDPADQEAAVQFLKGMQKSMGWCTTHIIDNLRKQWDS